MYIPGPVLDIVSSLLSIGTPSFVHILSMTELLRVFGHSIFTPPIAPLDWQVSCPILNTAASSCTNPLPSIISGAISIRERIEIPMNIVRHSSYCL